MSQVLIGNPAKSPYRLPCRIAKKFHFCRRLAISTLCRPGCRPGAAKSPHFARSSPVKRRRTGLHIRTALPSGSGRRGRCRAPSGTSAGRRSRLRPAGRAAGRGSGWRLRRIHKHRAANGSGAGWREAGNAFIDACVETVVVGADAERDRPGGRLGSGRKAGHQ
jgi:hypothetical protein